MTLVESREEALWGLRWMQDAVQNSGKTKPGFYPVIGLLGAAGKLGEKSFVNNAACWSTGENVPYQGRNFSVIKSVKIQRSVFDLLSTFTIICSDIQIACHYQPNLASGYGKRF